jgi:transposase-like protein
MELETPRDRNGSSEAVIVSKSQTRFDGFDDKIISMYSRGMTTREIEGHLREIYISIVTAASPLTGSIANDHINIYALESGWYGYTSDRVLRGVHRLREDDQGHA